jgi:ATP-dependent DNA ligase
LCAFDLLEVNGEDIRPEPIEDRKRRLAGCD